MSLYKGAETLKQQQLTKHFPIYKNPEDSSLSEKKMYNYKLQRKLTNFKDYVNNSISRIKNYLFLQKFCLNDEELKVCLNWIDEIIWTDHWFQTKGKERFYRLTNDLGNVSITKETFHLLNSIIDHQFDLSQEILNNEVNFITIQPMNSYICEVIGYLEFDLDLESVPRIISNQSITIKGHGYRIYNGYYDQDQRGQRTYRTHIA